MIRVLLCDDQHIVSAGLSAILSTAPNIDVVGIANDGAEAVEMAGDLKPDVVLMDLKMPVMNGIQATREIVDKYPATKVLVLTTYDADEWVFNAIRAGAAGYILKDTPREGLIAAIKGTAAGNTHIDPAVAGKLFSHVAANRTAPPMPENTLAASLTEREQEVLELIAHGLNNVDIANRLHLSAGTVRNYVSSIFSKLGVSDRTQAAVIALRYGMVARR